MCVIKMIKSTWLRWHVERMGEACAAKTAYLGQPTSSGPSEISLEGWSHQRPEEAEYVQMVAIGTWPRGIPYFSIGVQDPLRVADLAKYVHTLMIWQFVSVAFAMAGMFHSSALEASLMAQLTSWRAITPGLLNTAAIFFNVKFNWLQSHLI